MRRIRPAVILALAVALTGCARAPAPRPSRPLHRPPSIVLTGDILLAGRAERLIDEKGSAAPFAHVADLLSSADVAVGNLECALSTRGKAADKQFTFRADPRTADALSEAGFDVMTLANNHSADYGPQALSDTIGALRQAGIGAVGAGANAEGARAPTIVSAGQPPLRIAFAGFSNMQPTSFYATATRPGTNPAPPDAIAKEVRAARGQADVVIAVFHWGNERSETPTARQRMLAYTAADAGADLVVGHHPHVLQGFELRGHTLIAYSLGNFLFPSRGDRRSTMVLRYTPSTDRESSVEVIPCMIDGFQPRLADESERARSLARLRRISAVLGAEVVPDAEGRIAIPARRASVDKPRSGP